jgi:hypothetical protein
MNINANNQSLINILLQQASKTKEKKRPTFEEVFAKLNARTAGMNANKQPLNNMLTNEQLFRYYIKETDPKLRISDDSFNVEDALNPMKDGDPTKIYGSGTTQTGDIPSRNPYNNAPNVGGYGDTPLVYNNPPPQQSNKPISGKFASLASLASLARQYNMPQAPMQAPMQAPLKIATAPVQEQQLPTTFPDMSVPLPIGGDAIILDFNMAQEEFAVAQTIVGRMDNAQLWANTPQETQTIFSILFNNNDFYTTETTEYMKGLIRAGTIEQALEGINTIFKQTKGNQAVNDFITERIALMMGIDTTAGIGAVEKFNKLYNPNNIGIGEGKMSMERFTANVLNYLNKERNLEGNEKLRVDKTIIDIEDRGLKDNIGKYFNDVKSKYDTLKLQYDALMPTPDALMGDLFYDGDTEMRSNTGINSTMIDPEILNKLREMNKPSTTTYTFLPPPPSLSSLSVPSSMSAEAGTGEIDIDNVITRKGRGADILPRSRRTKEEIARGTLDLTGAKGGRGDV